ncbi:hypothetical protein ACFPN4_02720 [Ureibacillus thermophilus]|uniref:hypothetical protein n=1 Tax=Ureibacillus thermophilus TaxID=367743 RepID=UPI003611B0F5
MTIPSFQPIQNQQMNVQKSPLVLKQGQVFYGSVKQLYPNQTAEIQIGGHRLVAKLETPLKVGDAHFFQVTSTNPEAQLKVVSGPIVKDSLNVQQLMESLNLPKSQEMQQLLSHFLKNQLPIAKEQLLQAESWLKNLPEGVLKQEALQALQKLVDLKIPFTEEGFKALLFGSKTNGITKNLEQFVKLLEQNSQISPQVKANLFNAIESIAKPFQTEKAGMMIARSINILLQSEQGANSKDALNLLIQGSALKNEGLNEAKLASSELPANQASKEAKILTNGPTPRNETLNAFKEAKLLAKDSAVKTAALNILKEAAILPKEANLENWLNLLKVSSRNETAGSFISQLQFNSNPSMAQKIQQITQFIENEPNLSAQQKNAIHQLVKSFEGSNHSEQLVKQLHTELLKAYSEQTLNGIFTKEQGISPKVQLLSLLKHELAENPEIALKNIAKIFENSNEQATKAMLAESEATLLSKLNGQGMEKAIHTILKNLGLSFEAALNKNADIETMLQSLKPQLLLLVQDEHSPAELKNAAEILLARLNGMQLLSGEAGHQHQIIMQIPLHFLGKQVDATVQWNGRMNKDGKIDSDFARILFYLNLEALKETVIDMQVQNRIVTIYVYNEQKGLEVFAEPLKKTLKAGLEERNYHLSGVMFKPFAKKESLSKTMEKGNDCKTPHKGVDIRI